LLPACLPRLLQFVSDVMKPMTIDPLMDLEVQNLSGGELQRVALALCLGQPADIYLIDEPSAYLDSEQRIMASKVRGDGESDAMTATQLHIELPAA
jgi:translation initiation factor RLI1